MLGQVAAKGGLVQIGAGSTRDRHHVGVDRQCIGGRDTGSLAVGHGPRDTDEGDALHPGAGDVVRAVVQAQAQRELLFTFVLPFKDAEPVELQFRRPPRQGDEQPPFIVNVHSRNEALGEIWLKTQLNGLDKVELTMWALQGGVVEQAKNRSAELASTLTEAGLTMQSFQVIHGPRPDSQPDWKPSGRGMVVDLSA